MAKRGILVLLIVGMFMFVGCQGAIDTTLDWAEAHTEWTNDDDGQLSYVDPGDGSGSWIDLGWYATPGDTNTWEMCFMDEADYTVANNVLTGQYTYNGDTTTTYYDIVITFNYNSSADTVSFSCVGEGILNGMSFSYYPVTD